VTGRPVHTASPRPAAAPDAALGAAVLLLAGFGLVMMHSTTAPLAESAWPVSPHFLRHAGALGLGALLAMGVARVPLAAWRHLALPLWLGCCALLVATLVAGVEVNGARRWLEVPGLRLRFQPGELAKLATLVTMAALLATPDGALPRSPARLWAPALVALVPALLLLPQPDLGGAVLLLAMAGTLLFVAGAPLRLLAPPLLLGGLGAAAYVASRDYAWRRLVGFLDPWARSDAEGFQLVQSFVAFARGGLLGVGIGDGRQKLYYLPEAHTDFILAVVAEETGALGALAVLGAFAALAVAGVGIARRARDRFALFLAFAATALLVLPALANAAVVTGSLPTKGLALPFLSYGRSALLTAFAAVGLLLAVARQTSPETGRFRR